MKTTSISGNAKSRTINYNFKERCADITLGLMTRNIGVINANSITTIKR